MSDEQKITYKDSLKHDLAEATRLLVKHGAWDIAKKVIEFIQEQENRNERSTVLCQN